MDRTNALLKDLRDLVVMKGRGRKNRKISEIDKHRVMDRLNAANEEGYVDWVTVSSNLLFSNNIALSFDEFKNSGTLYNNIVTCDYIVDKYLDGLEITCVDYNELTDRYKGVPGVLFIVDPPTSIRTCLNTRRQNIGMWMII